MILLNIRRFWQTRRSYAVGVLMCLCALAFAVGCKSGKSTGNGATPVATSTTAEQKSDGTSSFAHPATQPQPGTTVPSAGQDKKTSPVQKGAPPTDTSITLTLTQHYASKDYHYTCHPTLESQKKLKLMTFGGEMELPGEQKEMPSDSTTITLQDPPSTWYCTKNHDR